MFAKGRDPSTLINHPGAWFCWCYCANPQLAESLRYCGLPHLLLWFESNGPKRHMRETPFLRIYPVTDTDREEIRAEMRRRRSAIGDAGRELAAYALSRHLMAAHFYRASRRIAAYLALGEEIDVNPVIVSAWKQGKEVYVPVIESARRARMRFARLRPDTPVLRNRFGIDEPAPEHRELFESRWLDLVLVPLVAFDRHGHRIGMGGGYYDRCFSFLKYRSHWKKPRLCGVAYDFQETDKLASAEWDVSLACVATDKGLLPASRPLTTS